MNHAIIVFTVICCYFYTFADKLEILAILPVSGQGITDQGLNRITNNLRKEIEKTNKSITMNRQKMDKILFEKGFISIYACDDLSCAQTLGQALSTEYVAQSRIAKVGDVIAFNLRVINIRNQKMVISIEEYIDGTIDTLIVDSFPSIAKRIVNSCIDGFDG